MTLTQVLCGHGRRCAALRARRQPATDCARVGKLRLLARACRCAKLTRCLEGGGVVSDCGCRSVESGTTTFAMAMLSLATSAGEELHDGDNMGWRNGTPSVPSVDTSEALSAAPQVMNAGPSCREGVDASNQRIECITQLFPITFSATSLRATSKQAERAHSLASSVRSFDRS